MCLDRHGIPNQIQQIWSEFGNVQKGLYNPQNSEYTTDRTVYFSVRQRVGINTLKTEGVCHLLDGAEGVCQVFLAGQPPVWVKHDTDSPVCLGKLWSPQLHQFVSKLLPVARGFP